MRGYRAGIALGDVLAVTLGVAVAFRIRLPAAEKLFSYGEQPTHTVPSYVLPYPLVAILLGLLWLAWIALGGNYSLRTIGDGPEEYKGVLAASFRAAATIAVVCFLTKSDLARVFFGLSFLIGTPLLLLLRFGSRKALHHRRTRGAVSRRVVVVGGMASATELIEILRRERWTGFRVVGVCLPHGVHALAVQGIPVIGTPATVRRAVEEAGADTVFVASGLGATGQDTRRLTWRLEGTGTQIAVLPSLTDVSGPRIRVKPIAGLPLLYLELPEFSGTQRTIKRLLDLAVAGIALVLATPVLLLIAAGIRLGSPGPVLFRQTRVGRGGELFTCLKFRTMVQEAESQLAALQDDHDGNGLLFKLRHDPRVTRLGRPLRRYSLDELPQLVNVLKGDMSLVGPRPPLPSEVARYPDDLRRRLLVRPGLTGLWQVSGRSDLSAADSSRLDLYYVDNWSVMYDAQIVWKTLGAVVAGRGAF